MNRNRDLADFDPEYYSGKNLLINGCLSEYQRGESGADFYVADRWVQSGISASSKNKTNPPKGHLQGHYLARDVAGDIFFGQRIEAAISAQAAGEDATFSFELYGVTGVDNIEVVAYLPSSKDVWTNDPTLFFTKRLSNLTDGRKAVTIPNLPEAVKHGLYVGLKATASSSGSYKTTGLQLELGDEATRFVPDLPSVNQIKCQRYYEKGLTYGYCGGASQGFVERFQVQKRLSLRDCSVKVTPANHFTGASSQTILYKHLELDSYDHIAFTNWSDVYIGASWAVDAEL